ncbi:MAG: pirin family protein [Gammaproteobacteria bacterium]|nr:pirin family protein [Gammaproteobacteria bacterium]MCK5262367.1 pirin family protein [Gammaproteobacteria bacterium]
MKPKIFVRTASLGAEGDGAEVQRLFPANGFMNFDPFVLWDHFNVSPGCGFPDHPHRGFEGITYIFEGSMKHKDNLGNESIVLPGGLQRFTAGSGIIHSEMPSPGSATKGIQLWVNLPQSLKKIEPTYQQVDTDSVPEHKISGGLVRELIGKNSPLQLKTPVRYLDIKLDAGIQFDESLDDNFRGLVYVVEGQVEANNQSLIAGQGLFFEGLNTIDFRTLSSVRMLLCYGSPHGEPIQQHGPYVD